jgi:hypothetical protein
MAKIYKYQKVIDAITTHCLTEPDYNLLDTEDCVTELCVIGDDTYVSVPDELTLPPQPEEITVEEIELTDELTESIKAASPHVALINERVVSLIREAYSVNEEIKMLRLAPSSETAAYNDYVEECRAWGRAEKAKLGL